MGIVANLIGDYKELSTGLIVAFTSQFAK